MADRRPTVRRPFLGQRDAEGRRRCGLCGTPVPGRRIDWCSDDCVERYLIAKGDQNAARRFLWRRDLGVCSLCGTNTVPPEAIEELRAHGYLGRPPAAPARDCVNGVVRDLTEREALARLSPRTVGAPWDADHTIPIAEGGALARENLRTLCRPCHKRATAELRERLAARRREGATA